MGRGDVIGLLPVGVTKEFRETTAKARTIHFF